MFNLGANLLLNPDMNFFYRFSFKLALVLCLVAVARDSLAQDLHFSQFQRSSANLNPALTGVFPGDLRFVGNYRSQWTSVPVPYHSVSGAFDSRLERRFLGSDAFLGYGLLLNNDLAGDAKLGMTELGLNLSYGRQLSPALIVSLGLQLAVGQRSVQPDKLSFEEQWNGEIHDPDLPGNELFGGSRGIFSASAGLNLRYQSPAGRTRMDFGTGFFHLNRPMTAFTDDTDVKLPVKGNFYALPSFQIHPAWDLKASLGFSSQLSYRETIGGLALRYHLSAEENKELAVQVGLAYRLKDAFIPSLEIQVRNWCAGISYDITLSPFKTAANRQGGPEIFLEYILWKVAPPKEFKACPVF